MSKLRSLNTSFWSDPWIETLTPEDKLLFIYLITNEKTNMLGIYEASVKKISFETGIENETVSKALKGFERVGKVNYINNHVILINFMKHQNFNPNMMKSAIDIYNNLPEPLKINNLDIDKKEYQKGFERLSKAMGTVRKVEVEREYEYEYEVEDETESLKGDTDFTEFEDLDNPPEEKEKRKVALKEKVELWPTFEDFWDAYDKKRGLKDKVEEKWEKLKQKEKEQIMAYIPDYILSQPDKQFRKDPSTFLNNRSWEDEIIHKDQIKPKINQRFAVLEKNSNWNV